MATPHVAGVAALLRSLSPQIPVELLKQRLRLGLEPQPALVDRTLWGGRLNAFRALEEQDMAPPHIIGDLAVESTSASSIGVHWTATGDDGAAGTAALYQVRHSQLPITDVGFFTADRSGGEPVPAPAGMPEHHVVQGLDSCTTYRLP